MSKAKRSVGRPRTSMTPQVIDTILQHVREGIWPERAARLAGIDAAAMRKHKERHPDFVTELEKAEAQAETNLHGRMLRAMDDNWTAVAWMLERRFPQRYGKQDPKVVVHNEAIAQAGVAQIGPPQPNPEQFAQQLQQATQLAQHVLQARLNEPAGGT
jgi:transposase